MYIVLSQRITDRSEYKDVPFVRYHFPRRYKNQIHSGDVFLYYQGKSGKFKSYRYYFGVGVVGEIYPDKDQGDHLYADLVDARPLPSNVPIYEPTGGYYESIGFQEVRQKPVPAWQNSVRRISVDAFSTILHAASADDLLPVLNESADIESQTDWMGVLERLNQKYLDSSPTKRLSVVDLYVDRGSSVSRVLKEILGSTCQICGVAGFRTHSGKEYVEAHHLVEVSKQLPGSLCSENIILVCPTCHKKLHHARFTCTATDNSITIAIFNQTTTIDRNTYIYLAGRRPQLLAAPSAQPTQ